VVSRSSATIENHDTASDTDHHAGRRRNLANNFNESNEAVESTLAIQGAAPSIRSPPSSETISVNRTWRADRTEDANRLEHANGHEHTGDTAPSDWTSAADVTPRFPRLIIADASADNRHTVRPLIPAFGSPSLRPRAPTDDGGRQALVNSLTGVAPRASSTTTLGGARRPSLARASSRGALANDSVPENGVFPGRADTSQAAGDVHISDNDIIADGPLPAAGDTPIVGTMPAIGRDAYITVQCPNGEVSFPGYSSIGPCVNRGGPVLHCTN
jgi:hypothetical protein